MGPGSSVYTKRLLTAELCAEVDAYLASVAKSVTRTRKGKSWDVWANDRPLHVEIRATLDAIMECEDELLALNLLPDDVPTRIILSAGLNDEQDYDVLGQMALALARLLDGVSTPPSK